MNLYMNEKLIMENWQGIEIIPLEETVLNVPRPNGYVIKAYKDRDREITPFTCKSYIEDMNGDIYMYE